LLESMVRNILLGWCLPAGVSLYIQNKHKTDFGMEDKHC